MNGADGIVRTLRQGGVEICFANPGTSEIHIVGALSRTPEIRAVPCLFEGVAIGAADGYARMSAKPACTLLHLGPGFANGIANLHNAKRAHVPLLNVIGDHATYHLKHDAPLTSDIAAIARPYSTWVKSASAAATAGEDCAEAIAAARTSPGGIATFIVPADVAWGDGGCAAVLPDAAPVAAPSAVAVEHAQLLLRNGKRTAILLGDRAAQGEALISAGHIAAATGAKLLVPFSFSRIERGAGRPVVTRIPYVMEQALALLQEFEQIILVAAQVPAAFFAYPGKPGILTPPDCDIHVLAHAEDDYGVALSAIAASDSISRTPFEPETSFRPEIPHGRITLDGLAAVVGALLPEHAIVVDESITSGRGLLAATRGCKPHDWLVNTGGSIGLGTPLAIGAAIACPDRPVLCLCGDGSFMYTLQALWTAARESLNTTFVVFANRSYAILKGELTKLDNDYGRSALDLLDIGRPDLDFVKLAGGLGVPARRAEALEEFSFALKAGLDSRTPNLIEVTL